MPSAKNSELDAPQVDAFTDLLAETLDHARIVKPTNTIDPPLSKADFEPLLSRLPTIFPCAAEGYTSVNLSSERTRQNAVVETAARNVFSSLLASTSIDSPDFVQIWNLLDVVSFLSDDEQCDPALLFWLVEELLDSQTIDACRNIFDFLESRRERITAKNLKQKQLVILRSCNDLLRRLSRAEDAAFCGRVFIFMFQSLPPGDRSSVNLRGEYHVENVTSFEETSDSSVDAATKMEVDAQPVVDTTKNDGKEAKPTAKAVSFDSRNKPESDKPLDTNVLYPIFWSLQHHFSQPTTLFDAAQLTKFKAGLEATMAGFETVQKLQRNTKSVDESKIVPQKRKAPEEDGDLRSSNINPKYLTSRELFELEIGDLYFRRHILIQAFVILDFLLSLTPQAKAKLAKIAKQNNSVVYNDKNLAEDDAKWATAMKERITAYIQAQPDGYFFFRVVESVISRDKGWVRWKVESCPLIERPPVTPSDFNEAKASARRMATNKRLRPTPMGSLSLDFLKEEDPEAAMEKLKDPERWKLPELTDLKAKITGDDLDFDFAANEREKSQILEAKASKTWRALRIARRTRLARFDRVDDWQNIEPIFQDKPDQDDESDAEEAGQKGKFPEDRRPIIFSGPDRAEVSDLASRLLERQKGVFGKVIQHTTRNPKDGEINGRDYHFVNSKEFNTILDGDYFIEFDNDGSTDYGTSRTLANAVEEAGKVPVIQLSHKRARTVKENGYSARFIHIRPQDIKALEPRLRKATGLTEDEIRKILKDAREEMDDANSEDLYDTVISSDDPEASYKALEDFIYASTGKTNGVNGDVTSARGEISMKDAPVDGGDAT